MKGRRKKEEGKIYHQLTCCEICTDNRPLLQCLVVKYISTYCLNLIHETSSVETFACE